jgi:3'(2'), 5'-bisphosphate nucleotidase
MVGLAVDHRPAVGVVYQPVSRRLFLAATGAGSWLWAPDGAPLPIRCSAVDDLTQARLVASKSHRSSALDQVKSALGIANELNVGSVGLKLALIAVGERDLYVNPSSKTSSWDTCAPEVILREAGGTLSDLHGQPLSYAERDWAHRRGLVASNGRLHAAACAKLAGLFPTLE